MSDAVQPQSKEAKTQQKTQDNAIKAIEESMLSFQQTQVENKAKLH